MDAEAAQRLYDNSLALLLSSVRDGCRGLYRVMMSPEGLIESVGPARRGCNNSNSKNNKEAGASGSRRGASSASSVVAAGSSPNQKHYKHDNAFHFFLAGDGDTPPRAGSLDALSPLQQRMAQLLLRDTERLLAAARVAYALQRNDSPILRARAEGAVGRLAERFGALPEPALKREDEVEAAARREAERRERERAEAWAAVSPTVFEELLERERRLAEKRAAKKQQRRMAAASD